MRGQLIIGLAVALFASGSIGCADAEPTQVPTPMPTPSPTPTPKPELEIVSEREFWDVIMRSEYVDVARAVAPICEESHEGIKLYETEKLVRDMYEGRVAFGDAHLSRDGLLDARREYCSSPIVEGARRIVVTATPTPTPISNAWRRVGGGKNWTPRPTSTPYPTSTHLPSTPTPTITPTSTPIPTSTPYPTPASKEYVEPEYIRLASAAISKPGYPGSAPELQAEIWGRDLWGDEIWSISRGISAWTTADFERRCLMPDGQAADALEVVTKRIPNAVYRYNKSPASYVKVKYGQNYHWFYDRLDWHRTIETLYSFEDENGNEKWISTTVVMNHSDCSIIGEPSAGILSSLPTIWLCSRAYKPPEITPELSERCEGHPYSDFKGLMVGATARSLQPFEVESGDPSMIICRSDCD